MRGGVLAVSATCVAVLLSAPTAFADSPPSAQPSGATTQQTAAVDPTAASSQVQDSGTPGNSQVSQSAPAQDNADTSATSAGTGSSDGSPSASSTSAGTSSDLSASAGTPAATGSSDASGTPASSGSAPPSTDATGGTAPSSATQTVTSGAAANQGSPSNANTTVRVGQSGNDAPVGQSNDASTTSEIDPTNGVAPAAGDSSIGAAPPSNATADTAQTTPSNANVVVRVGSPGDVGGANQANNAQAAAAGTAGSAAPSDTISSGSQSGTISPSAQANASATQTAPGNINVVVRVASPGNNGPVTQQNTAGATAGATLPDAAATSSNTSAGSAATQQVVSTSGSSLAGNASQADQSIDQSNNQSAGITSSDPPPPVTAAPGTTIGSASATQTGAANMNVSVRIGSPGVDGAVTQVNSATATGTSAELGVVTVTGGADTNVAIVLPGSASGAPSSGPWIWDWTWSGAWTPPAGATADSAAPTAAAVWNWIWTNDPGGAAAPSSSASSAGAVPNGTWTWTWNWTRADGQTWSWTWSQSCSCNWTWTWNWDWSATSPASAPVGAPAGTPTAPIEGADIGAVTQSNAVSADSLASATISSGASSAQVVAPASETLSAAGLVVSQQLLSQQLASAWAEADQTGSWNNNVIWGVASEPVNQSNAVGAVAAAAVGLDVTQTVSQTMNVNEGKTQAASADQLIQSTQSAHAVSRALQTGSGNDNVSWAPDPNQALIGAVDQENSVLTVAGVSNWATMIQSIGQLEDIGSATVQWESAIQQLDNEQVADAEALASQLQTWNANLLLVPAGSRATNPSVLQQNTASTSSLAGNLSEVSQSTLQGAGGSADIQISSALQQVSVAQSAIASTPASQANLLNLANWLGVEPPLPPATGGPPETSVSTEVTMISSVRAAQISSGAALSIRGGTIVLQIGVSPVRQPDLPRSWGASSPEASARACVALCLSSGATAIVGAVPGGNGTLEQNVQLSHSEKSQQEPACACMASPGPAGSAPSGSGPVGINSAPYTFAAPALERPQLSTSVLGRPMAFFDPLERPG